MTRGLHALITRVVPIAKKSKLQPTREVGWDRGQGGKVWVFDGDETKLIWDSNRIVRSLGKGRFVNWVASNA